MNKKMHYKQLQHINATADYITRIYKTALHYAMRGDATLNHHTCLLNTLACKWICNCIAFSITAKKIIDAFLQYI